MITEVGFTSLDYTECDVKCKNVKDLLQNTIKSLKRRDPDHAMAIFRKIIPLIVSIQIN